MARSLFAIVTLLLFPCLREAQAGERVVLDFQGYAWETGAFPPSAAGDRLAIPVIVDGLSETLHLDLADVEVSGWIAELLSQGSTELGGGVTSTRYTGGSVRFYHDAAMDHVFAANPPNAQVPATFVNGTLCLGGSLQNFELFFDSLAGSGAFEAGVVFTEGACLATARALRAEGFTFAGVLSRAAAAGNVPAGYDLLVDGLLEAQGVGPETCAFDCFALTAANFMFPRDAEAGFSFSTSKLQLEGVFVPCREAGSFDPESAALTIRLGNFSQTLPAGSLEREERGKSRRWRYRAPRDFTAITEVVLERDDGVWEFEIAGRRQSKRELLPDGPQLALQLTLGVMQGETTVILEERKKKLSYAAEEACGRDDKLAPPATLVPPQAGAVPGKGRLELLPAVPNPFNARVTFALRARESGPARLSLYDSRGRMLRLLFDGVVDVGEQRFVWDGTDARGVLQASGIYIVRLEAPGLVSTRKLVLAK